MLSPRHAAPWRSSRRVFDPRRCRPAESRGRSRCRCAPAQPRVPAPRRRPTAQQRQQSAPQWNFCRTLAHYKGPRGSPEVKFISPPCGESLRSSTASQKILAQPLARGKRGAQIEAVDDGEPKTAGRHGVLLGRAVLVKRDLDAGHARYALDLIDQRGRRVAIIATVRAEQHGAVAFARFVVPEIPLTMLVKGDQRLDPARAVKIGPLIGKTQV